MLLNLSFIRYRNSLIFFIALVTLNGFAITTVEYGGSLFDVDMENPAGIGVSPDGKNVYVADDALDQLYVFTRDTLTGNLTYSALVKDGVNGIAGLSGTSSVAVSPDGENVYVAAELENAISIFKRDS